VGGHFQEQLFSQAQEILEVNFFRLRKLLPSSCSFSQSPKGEEQMVLLGKVSVIAS
jgi:hypothetical protein